MPIASQVRECLQHFKILLRPGIVPQSDKVEDALGRFRLWVGNVSAHTTGRRSLQYRLRDSSELSSAVESYLQDLLGLLKSIPRLASNCEESHVDSTNNALGADDDADLFDVDDLDDVSESDEQSRAVAEANGIITCLLRISTALRNPARSDQIRYAEFTSTRHFEPHDIEHVRMKHPTAPEFLIERLGKAISRNRQYLKYREAHHEKMQQGLDLLDENPQEDRPSTVATTLNFQGQEEVGVAEYETESLHTVTSFAPTTSETGSLRVPPRPVSADEDDPVECPLCFCVITLKDDRSWREHVYEDIPPYLCLHEKCETAVRHYNRRREWQQHMKAHNLLVEITHDMLGNTDNKSAEILQEVSDAASNRDTTHSCPLCRQQSTTAKQWYKHVGHHLEQLSLFALPQAAFDEGDEDDTDELEASGNREASIEFTDALGRTFKFPFHLCKTWRGMLTQIKTAFMSVSEQILHDRVDNEHFDLLGPSGEIIYPSLWESTVQPNWVVAMQMWPFSQEEIDSANKSSSIPRRDTNHALDDFVVDPFDTTVWRSDINRPGDDFSFDAFDSTLWRPDTNGPAGSSLLKVYGRSSPDSQHADLIERGSPLQNTHENKPLIECPISDCEYTTERTDSLRRHMATHENERPEKCPFATCEYHTRGFARKYDRNRHVLRHYKGTIVCGFCPGSGSAAEKTFNRVDVFKRHLTSVHGVEQTLPNRRNGHQSNSAPLTFPLGSGKCSTCGVTFATAQDLYDHLDQCVLRAMQHAQSGETVNEGT